jgi:hypothetical protein
MPGSKAVSGAIERGCILERDEYRQAYEIIARPIVSLAITLPNVRLRLPGIHR